MVRLATCELVSACTLSVVKFPTWLVVRLLICAPVMDAKSRADNAASWFVSSARTWDTCKDVVCEAVKA